MSDTLLNVEEVTKRLGVSQPTLYRLMSRGQFPRQLKLGASARWPESEVQAFVDGLKAARDGEVA